MRYTTITTTAVLPVTQDDAFAVATTAGRWPDWHPSSISVTGAVEGSTSVGDRIREQFRVAGRDGHANWTVVSNDRPRTWAIEGVIEGRTMGGKITYEFAPAGSGTRFTRTFVYPVPWRFALVERILIRRRIRAESETATRRLAQLLSAAT
jgi:hypothetical protein